MANPWRTIADAEVDANSPIKEQLIEALYYNPLAAAENVAGAPDLAGTAIKTNDLDGSKMADGILGGSYIDPLPTEKFADGVVVRTDVTGGDQTPSPPGGYQELVSALNPAGQNLVFNAQSYYMLGWGSRVNVAGTVGIAWVGIGQLQNIQEATYPNLGTYAQVKQTAGAGGYIYFKLYYFNASPPYDIGHGQVAGFIYAKVKPNGEIAGVSISGDPPWYCSPRASQVVMKGGVNFCRRRRGVGITPAQAKQTPGGWAAYLDAIRNPVYDEIPMDNTFKNENMDRFPHPGIGSMDPGDTMVLIEPSGDLAADIMSLYNAGDDPSGMIQRGDIKIKPGAIAGHKAPRGVIPVRAEWR